MMKKLWALWCAAMGILGCGGSENADNTVEEKDAGTIMHDAGEQSNLPDRVIKYQENTIGVTYWYDTKYNFFGEWLFSEGEYKLFPLPVQFLSSDENTEESDRYYYDPMCLNHLDWVGYNYYYTSSWDDSFCDDSFDLFDFINQNNRNRGLAQVGDDYCFVNPDSARKVYIKYTATQCEEFLSALYVGFLNSDMSDCFGKADLASYVPEFEEDD